MNPSVRILAAELRRTFTGFSDSPGLRLLENEPMDRHCSFHIGGPAALFIEPSGERELAALLRFFHDRGIIPLLLGSGTNVLIPDQGLETPVIHLGEGMSFLAFEGTEAEAGAGLPLSRLAAAARDRGLSGLEFAHGIPGTLGGGIMMNAGAYGGEMKDIVYSVRYLDLAGEFRETTEPGFGYRHSRFMDDTPGVILSARLSLSAGEPEIIGARMRELADKRAASQPLRVPSAGSAFKRPKEGSAAALIDAAGLKGFRIGDAMVSEKHAGFIVNVGNASCADVLALLQRVRETVEQVSGILLEPEIRLLA